MASHDIANFEELVAGEHFEHMIVLKHQHGVAGERYGMEWAFSVFPDHRLEIEDVATIGDRVAVRGTRSGTHKGELWGVPPTGESFAVQQVHWFRVSDGKEA
jgi:predicted ester cyclase